MYIYILTQMNIYLSIYLSYSYISLKLNSRSLQALLDNPLVSQY